MSCAVIAGIVAVNYPLPVLQERVALFFDGRYAFGSFSEEFPKLGGTGGAMTDEHGNEVKESVKVGVGGPHLKLGISVGLGPAVQR